jgi:ligand-binding sensor domain-containing protein
VIIHYDPLKNQILDDIAEFQTSGPEYQGPFWINETSKGQFWFGGVNTLVCFDRKQNAFIQNKKVYPDEYDIKFREAKQLYEDRENNIWISTNNGLYFQ